MAVGWARAAPNTRVYARSFSVGCGSLSLKHSFPLDLKKSAFIVARMQRSEIRGIARLRSAQPTSRALFLDLGFAALRRLKASLYSAALHTGYD
jgi:hypothetical protein